MKHKYSIFFLIGCIVCSYSFTQPQIGKQKTIGGSDGDGCNSLGLTKDGGFILGGTSSSDISGDKTQNNRGRGDYWVVKLDSSLNIQWDKTIGGSESDDLYCIEQTADNGYILGGYSFSNISGEKTDSSRGLADYWVVKLDRHGNIQWDKTIGGKKDDRLTWLQQTKKGDYIIGGYSTSNSSREKSQDCRGRFDYWILKLDSLGNIIWDKTIGGTDNDWLFSLQQTNEGGYILGGRSESDSSGEKTSNAMGRFDYWVVKLDGKGNVEWDKTIGGNSEDGLYSLQQTTDGGYILGGTSASNISGQKTENSRGQTDYWVVKLNSLGSIEWDKTIGGNLSDGLQSIQQTTDGGYIATGASVSTNSGEKTEKCRGYWDYWTVKLNSSGTVEWDKTIGGTDNDNPSAIKETRNNHYVLGGYSASGISGDKTRPSKGSNDYWIVFLNHRNKAFTKTIISGESTSVSSRPFGENNFILILILQKIYCI